MFHALMRTYRIPTMPLRAAIVLLALLVVTACDSTEPAPSGSLGSYSATLTGNVEASLTGSASMTSLGLSDLPVGAPEWNLSLSPTRAPGADPLRDPFPAFMFDIADAELALGVLSLADSDAPFLRYRGTYFEAASVSAFWRSSAGTLTLERVDDDIVAGRFDATFTRVAGGDDKAQTFEVSGTFEARRLEL
ncbi:MAG: hypothetical protein AAGF92_24715 [Myxococcota bacterium]